jgi:hypothetical protein
MAKSTDITEAAIRRAANGKSYRRGDDYFRRGMVSSLQTEREVVVGMVSGTRDYDVRLWADGGEVEGECSCPMGRAGEFCKHLVATGLAYLAGGVPRTLGEGGQVGKPRRRQPPPRPKVTMDHVREHLLHQPPADLVGIIMRQAEEDDRLRESLLMEVARRRPGALDVATFRAAVDASTDTGGFVDYRAAYSFTTGIEKVVDSIAELLDAGHAAEVVELTEHALHRCEQALGQMDDSDGDMGSTLERLQELHHASCVKAKPDPEALARRLIHWEIEGEWDTFRGSIETYADVLGEQGLAVYRALAEEIWKQMPQLGPGDRCSFDGRRYPITSIMESIARSSGDIEQLVAVKARDLSSAWTFLQIAETYRQAGLADTALEWAERGVGAFPDAPDDRLVDFLADEYHRRQRHDDALSLIWSRFCRRKGPVSYQDLKSHADRDGQWPHWREKALAAIRTDIEERKRDTASRPKGRREAWRGPVDHSTLVDIFLWEGDVETAWQEAQAGGCCDSLWMRLAELRELEHPADALLVYQRRIDPIVNVKQNDAYREAAQLIRTIQELMVRLGREGDFPAYLESVRGAHKPKRNFMAMLRDM